MNKMFRIFCATAALLIAMPVFGGGTYYSKVNASVASGSGRVYVSAMTSAATPSQITQTTASATFGSSGYSATTASANHVYYMVARGDAGYALEKWNDGDTSNPRRVVVKEANGKKENSATTVSYTATFAPTRLSVESSDYYLGWPVISKSINAEGDRVKLSVEYAIPPANSEFGSFRKSVSVTFEGWYDQEGRLVSDQESFDYTVGPQETLTARFGHDLVLDKDDITGYYRLGTPTYVASEKGTREFLSIIGSMKYSFTDRTYFTTDIKLVKSMSDPAAIFFVTGTPNRDAIRSKSQRETVVEGVDASAQGVKISDIVKN
ncbi:MAG: hypothetical protein K2O10_04975, partial [Muribaculaceae bacterium]|nr:hypothetical protein [Muribaculaceae bacterium]